MPVGRNVKGNDRHNLVSVVAGELVWIETGGANPPDVLVPSEYAPAFAVDLPLAQHRVRVAALPFAIEDRIAQPIDELHVALGPEVGARRYLAAVAATKQMAEWQAILATHRISPRRIIPDATTLAEVGANAHWAVRVEGPRILILTRESEAFATSIGLFDALWSAAGRPALQQEGPNWLPSLPQPVARLDAPKVNARGRFVVDLKQSSHQGAGRRYAGPIKIAAGLIAAAALAHTAILAIDTGFTSAFVAQRKTEVVRLLTSLAPLTPPGEDPAAILAGMLPDGDAGADASRFLPLLSRVSSSLQPVSTGVAVQALSYDAADGALVMKIEAADLPALERVQRSLADAGFDSQSGGATVGDGRAESSITVRETASEGGAQ